MIRVRSEHDEQIRRLRALTHGGGYGVLLILSRHGDVPFTASPVPALRGYEICAASSDGLYDIWKDGTLKTPGQSRQQIKKWIRDNTPVWLMDDSTPTKKQKALFQSWATTFLRRYPGIMTVG